MNLNINGMIPYRIMFLMNSQILWRDEYALSWGFHSLSFRIKELKEVCKIPAQKCPISINVFLLFCIVDAIKYAEVTDIQIEDYGNSLES